MTAPVEKKHLIQTRVSPELAKKLKYVCEVYELSEATVLRICLDFYLLSPKNQNEVMRFAISEECCESRKEMKREKEVTQ